MRKLVSELRRRNVLRVAAAYALVAWIIIEAGSVLLPTFGASDAVFQTYVILVIAGFVIAVVFAWVFELTPEGVKLERNVDRSAPVDAGARQKMNYAIIGLLVLALGVSITFNVMGLRDAGSAPPPALPRSLAVLPFESRSLGGDPENELFTDGVHDDLLTRLANIASLKVISRTSVMEYRGTSKSPRQIGGELDVEAVLLGSVQRLGESVRINMQLFDARTERSLWSRQFDRQYTLQNVFAVQSEISEAVADALKATLTPHQQSRLAQIPTRDLRAFRLHSEGRRNLYERRIETLRAARRNFEEAVALDPQFAEAHAGLAESIVLLHINHQDIPRAEAARLANESLDRALALDPTLADAHAIRGLLQANQWMEARAGDGNLEAEASFMRALAEQPNHASAHMWFASLRDSEDRLDDAIELYQQSMDLDPLGRIPYANLPMIYAKRGEHEKAMELWLEAVRIIDDWPTLYSYIAAQLWSLGRLDEGYAWHARAVELSAEPWVESNINLGVLVELGEFERARQVLDAFPAGHPLEPLAKGFHQYLEGDFRGAHRRFMAALDVGTVPANFVYTLAADTALLAGDLAKARELTLAADPALSSDATFRVDRYNARSVVKLAYIHQREGDKERAFTMLNQALDVIRDLPRLGTFGFGIRDVQIYALLGRRADALAAFREALDAGFRGSIFFDGWPLALDPYLDSVRDDPQFVEMLNRLDGYLAVMRDRLIAAETSGALDSLRALAESS